MKIERTLWDDGCPNGIDCEKTYATDAGGVLVRLDRSRLVDADEARALGVELPDHEILAFVPDQQWNGGRG